MDAEEGAGHASRVRIVDLDDADGFRIDDTIERRHCEVSTPEPVHPELASLDAFRYPVDTAISVTTEQLSLSVNAYVYVHGADGVTEVTQFEEASFGDGSYELELTGPLKLYVRVDGPLTVRTGVANVDVVADSTRTFVIGARSFHERPAETVTTTDDPVDLMKAVSTFGSALKTTTCERSYPTLRGHPPALEYGSSLSIPRNLEPPNETLRIEVPTNLESVFTVSTLAYYLGCAVVPGDAARIVTDDGFAYDLTTDGGLERTAERVLKQVFLMDCLVRTSGERAIPLYERKQLEPRLDVALPELYDVAASRQLESYLEVSYDVLAEYVPTWKLRSYVTPAASSIDVLSYLVNELSTIRSSTGVEPPTAQQTGGIWSDGGTDVMRRPSDQSAGPVDVPAVELRDADSIEQAWVGEGAPIGASKAMAAAYRNRFDREPRQGTIEIVVVCNDEGMLEERDVVRDVYGSRDDLPFNITFYETLSEERLRLVLESDIDFFHYIGHVEDGGFQCTDGMLDAASLDHVGIDLFFLNACRSYQQGKHLIERGAIGGVVTLDDIINSGAIRIGKTMARLLNVGFPLRPALNIAKDRSIVGSQYLVIGDGNADIGQADADIGLLAKINTQPRHYDVELWTYMTSEASMGTQFSPSIADNANVYLCPGYIDTFSVTTEQLEQFLSLAIHPVLLDDVFDWSDRVELD